MLKRSNARTMRIHEIIDRTGISEKSIRYYIEKDVLHPTRDENGYFNFSENDVKVLRMIKSLREIGLSTGEIHTLLTDRNAVPYELIHLQKELHRQRSKTEWRYRTVSELIDKLRNGSDTSLLIDELSDRLENETTSQDDRMIDMIDAEMLADYFWGTVLKNSKLTEYQQFLWSRLKEKLVTSQSDSLRRLRDFLYRGGYSYFTGDETLQIVSELKPDDLAAYEEALCRSCLGNLDDISKVSFWLNNYENYVKPVCYYYDNQDCREIMREMSPVYASYQDNMNRICEDIREYFLSPDGYTLHEKIKEKLGDKFDPDANHSAEFVFLSQL